jgi:hypothetical protein
MISLLHRIIETDRYNFCRSVDLRSNGENLLLQDAAGDVTRALDVGTHHVRHVIMIQQWGL